MIDNLQVKITHATVDLEQMQNRYDALLHDSDHGNAHVTITVSGTIYANTQITGPHTSAILTESHRNVIIREIHYPDAPDERNEWKIEVVPR